MKLELPYPPGVNTLYGLRAYVQHGKPRAFPYKTEEHREYSTAVKLAVLEAGLKLDGPRWPKPAEVGMLVRLYRPRRAGDIDGPLKTLLDVLQGIVFENDDQVARLEVYRHDDKNRPRVEIEVTELPSQKPTLLELGFSIPVQVPRPPRGPISTSTDESLEKRLRRLAEPAHIDHRSGE